AKIEMECDDVKANATEELDADEAATVHGWADAKKKELT
ncbi:unnamed protein product, partial [marine sediment metagenome]